MSISLEQLIKILAKSGISFFQEDDILIAAKDVITPPEANKEESVFEESCISDEEHLFKLEIEEGIPGDHHANKCCIEQCFQISTRLDWFCFHFYFISFHFQYLIFHIPAYSRFSLSKLNLNLCLLPLHRWLHWKFHYT